MKKLKNLTGVKALNRTEQQSINGGNPPLQKFGPCGDTGGIIVASYHCSIGTYGTIWSNGNCWACY